MAPEVCSFQDYDQKADIFSVAMVFYEMMFGVHHLLDFEGIYMMFSFHILFLFIFHHLRYFLACFFSFFCCNFVFFKFFVYVYFYFFRVFLQIVFFF